VYRKTEIQSILSRRSEFTHVALRIIAGLSLTEETFKVQQLNL